MSASPPSGVSGVAAPHGHAADVRLPRGVRPPALLQPLLNQLQSSVQGQFRRMDRQQHTLKQKLAQNVSDMHTRIWKLKSRETSSDLSEWHSKEDLRSYLTAMSLLGATPGGGGGGRTLGKEKSAHFGHLARFKDTLDASRQSKYDAFNQKLRQLGIRPHTKKAALLWQMIHGEGERPPHTAMPNSRQQPATARGEVDEKEGENGSDEEGVSAAEEERMRMAVRDEIEAAQAAAAAAHASSSSSHHSAADSSSLSHASDAADASSSASPWGIAAPGRRIGHALIAPTVHQKADWELEEEAEERAEQQLEDEKRRAEEARKAEARKKEAGGGGHGEGTSARHPMLDRSGPPSARPDRRPSVLTSRIQTPSRSRRSSFVGAASALRAFNGQSTQRPLQLLPDKAAAVEEGPQLTDEQFAQEAARVMAMVFGQGSALSAFAAQQQEQDDLAAQHTSRSQAPPAAHTVHATPRPRTATASVARPRDAVASLSQQDDIERWNKDEEKRPPAGPKRTTVSQMAAMVDSKRAQNGGGASTRVPTTVTNETVSANYRASFDARMHSSGARSSRPASAAVPSARRRAPPGSHFGDSATSCVSTVHSVNGAVEFRDARGRKELVQLGKVTTPAEVFAGIEQRPGSTLQPFEQLQMANRALVDEAKARNRRKRAEAKAQEEEQQLHQHGSADGDGDESLSLSPSPADLQRDQLARKSRNRPRASRDGSPAKSLRASSSTGHLSQRGAKERSAAPLAHTFSPSHRTLAASSALSLSLSPLSLSLPGDAADPCPPHLLSPSGRDYVHLSPLLSVSRWEDVARQKEYGHGPPTRTGWVSQPQTLMQPHASSLLVPNEGLATARASTTSVPVAAAASADHQPNSARVDPTSIHPVSSSEQAHAFAVTVTPAAVSPASPAAPGAAPASASATPSPSPPPFAMESSGSSGSGDPTQPRVSREEEERLIHAQLDEEGFAGSADARAREVRRRRALAALPPPVSSGPSVFQQQKAALLKSSYSKFVAATSDLHRLTGATGRQRAHTIPAHESALTRRRSRSRSRL